MNQKRLKPRTAVWVEFQTADWKAQHKHECGKRLEEGESFVLCKWASRPELNGCLVEVVRGMDEATRRVGVRVLAASAPRAAAGAPVEAKDDGNQEQEEERKAKDGSQAVCGLAETLLSVKPENLKKSE